MKKNIMFFLNIFFIISTSIFAMEKNIQDMKKMTLEDRLNLRENVLDVAQELNGFITTDLTLKKIYEEPYITKYNILKAISKLSNFLSNKNILEENCIIDLQKYSHPFCITMKKLIASRVYELQAAKGSTIDSIMKNSDISKNSLLNTFIINKAHDEFFSSLKKEKSYTFYHEEAVTSSAISPDGLQIATGSYDKICRLWNTFTGECDFTATFNVPVMGVSYNSDGDKLAVLTNNKIYIYNPKTVELIITLMHENSIGRALFSYNNSNVLFAKDSKGVVQKWNLFTKDDSKKNYKKESTAISFGEMMEECVRYNNYGTIKVENNSLIFIPKNEKLLFCRKVFNDIKNDKRELYLLLKSQYLKTLSEKNKKMFKNVLKNQISKLQENDFASILLSLEGKV